MNSHNITGRKIAGVSLTSTSFAKIAVSKKLKDRIMTASIISNLTLKTWPTKLKQRSNPLTIKINS